MHISAFDFDLPPDLIAQEPASSRDGSRLLVFDRSRNTHEDRRFCELPALLEPGAVVVINNTRVFPARLMGRRKGRRAAIEVLLLRRIEGAVWEALVRPGRVLKEGTELEFGDGTLRGWVKGRLAEGRRIIEFDCPRNQMMTLLEKLGTPPLPPYIKRIQAAGDRQDRERYQTIYARHTGAVAAPTAGLHFSHSVFDELRANSIDVVELTHHVGYATFQPVRAEEIEDHRIEAEEYDIPLETASRINRARAERRPVVAVGTTVVRAIESAASEDGSVRGGPGLTTLFIYPGYSFRGVDLLVTNFHLPRSTLLMLVCAFAGRDPILRLYQYAIRERYRFYSYGDCMLIK